jgi:kinesin family protein 5
LSTLRFGARARNIKNTPKVNREFTVPELKKLLAKAEEKIENLEVNIKVL